MSINFSDDDGALRRYECLYMVEGSERVEIVHLMTEDGYSSVDDLPMIMATVLQFCVEEITVVAAVEISAF